jgi:hypothetical protein
MAKTTPNAIPMITAEITSAAPTPMQAALLPEWRVGSTILSTIVSMARRSVNTVKNVTDIKENVSETTA